MAGGHTGDHADTGVVQQAEAGGRRGGGRVVLARGRGLHLSAGEEPVCQGEYNIREGQMCIAYSPSSPSLPPPPPSLPQIFTYVGLRGLCRCSRVCRSWKAITESPELWNRLDLAPLGQRYLSPPAPLTTVTIVTPHHCHHQHPSPLSPPAPLTTVTTVTSPHCQLSLMSPLTNVTSYNPPLQCHDDPPSLPSSLTLISPSPPSPLPLSQPP